MLTKALLHIQKGSSIRERNKSLTVVKELLPKNFEVFKSKTTDSYVISEN